MALVPRNYAWVGVSLADLQLYVNSTVTIASAIPLPTLTLTYENTIAGLQTALDEFMAARGWRFV